MKIVKRIKSKKNKKRDKSLYFIDKSLIFVEEKITNEKIRTFQSTFGYS